jgi:hypothetical protein
MKIRVSFVLNIDADAWALEYGLDKSEVRADVQEHTYQNVWAHYSGMDLLLDGEKHHE